MRILLTAFAFAGLASSAAIACPAHSNHEASVDESMTVSSIAEDQKMSEPDAADRDAEPAPAAEAEE